MIEPQTSMNKSDFYFLKKERYQRINVLIKETLYNSIAQALIRIFQSRHFVLRAFLLICVVLTSALSSYLVIASIIDYFNYEVFTTSKSVFEIPTLFPKVTICNLNMFTTKYAIDFLKNINKLVEPEIDIFNEEQLARLNYSEKVRILENVSSKARVIIMSKNYTDENRKNIGHDLKDILISCYFNGNSCTHREFSWKFDRYLGNCFVFNSGKNSSNHDVDLKKTFISDSQFGLRLEMYVKFHENLTLINSIHGGVGSYIRFENSSYLIDDTVDNGISLKPGQAYSCSLSRLFRFNLPKPYSNCEIDDNTPKESYSRYLKSIAQSSYKYSQQLCFYQCLQEKLIKSCDCTIEYYVPIFNHTRNCFTENETNCSQKIISEFVSKNTIKDMCLSNCPLECNSSEFKILSTSYKLLGEHYVNFIKGNKNLSSDFVTTPLNSDTAGESVQKVTVFYNGLSYTQVNEYPKITIVSLLGSIGGNLSLFMGVSVFSLFELIEVLIETFFIFNEKNLTN